MLAARNCGYQTVVVTNQGGIALGLYGEPEMQQFNRALNEALRSGGGWIDAFYHCPYHPNAVVAELKAQEHPDRKPNPGMILRAAADLNIDLANSVLIGDRETDLAAANAAGVRGILFNGQNLEETLVPVLRDQTNYLS